MIESGIQDHVEKLLIGLYGSFHFLSLAAANQLEIFVHFFLAVVFVIRHSHIFSVVGESSFYLILVLQLFGLVAEFFLLLFFGVHVSLSLVR